MRQKKEEMLERAIVPITGRVNTLVGATHATYGVVGGSETRQKKFTSVSWRKTTSHAYMKNREEAEPIGLRPWNTSNTSFWAKSYRRELDWEEKEHPDVSMSSRETVIAKEMTEGGTGCCRDKESRRSMMEREHRNEIEGGVRECQKMARRERFAVKQFPVPSGSRQLEISERLREEVVKVGKLPHAPKGRRRRRYRDI